MKIRVFVLIVIIALPIGLQVSGVVDFLSLEYLRQNEAAWQNYRQQHPLAVLGIFIFVYTVVCALPIPAVAFLTLAAGMLFGLVNGLLVVSFFNAIGATIAFWLARYLGQEVVHKMLGKKITGIDRALDNAGFIYATSLRLIPGIPFFVINTALGLTTIRTATFYFSTQVGMLLMLGILVNAGNNLGRITTLEDALSLELVISLALIAVIPISVRLLLRRSKQKASSSIRQ